MSSIKGKANGTVNGGGDEEVVEDKNFFKKGFGHVTKAGGGAVNLVGKTGGGAINMAGKAGGGAINVAGKAAGAPLNLASGVADVLLDPFFFFFFFFDGKLLTYVIIGRSLNSGNQGKSC